MLPHSLWPIEPVPGAFPILEQGFKVLDVCDERLETPIRNDALDQVLRRLEVDVRELREFPRLALELLIAELDAFAEIDDCSDRRFRRRLEGTHPPSQ